MFNTSSRMPATPSSSLNDAFQKDPRADKVNLSIGIYFDDAGRIPVLDCVRQAEAQMLAESAPKPYLPIEGSAAMRTAVQQLLFGAGHEALTSGRVATLQTVGSSGGLKVGADFIKRWLPASAGLGQRPDLGQPPRDVRRRRLRCPHLPVLRRGQRRAQVRRHAGHAAQPAAAQRRAAARLLPQPHGRRPEARAVGGADPGPARARVAALPGPGLPGLRRRHRRRRLRGARAGLVRPDASSSPTRSPRA